MKLNTLFHFILIQLCIMSGAVHAEDYLLTEKTYKSLSAAQKLMDEEKYQQAGSKLQALLKETQADSYDQAVVQQTLGYLYSSQDKYKQAIDAFEKALKSNALPENVSDNLRFNLAQLLIAEGQYKKGVGLMETWIAKQQKVENQIYVMLASAHYRLENYKKVVSYISKVIQQDKAPNEDWYRMLLSAHMNLKQYKSAIKVLEKLITLYPYQKVYWEQLSALYIQQNKEVTALAVKMLAQRLDLGDATTLIHLSDMYRYLQIPYKSGKLLQQGIDDGVIASDFANLQRLADSWLAARESELAIATLQQMLSKDASGNSHLKLGQVYVFKENWQAAEKILAQAVKLVKGDKLGSAYLMLGTCSFHLKNHEAAKNYFREAISYKAQANQASQWLRHLEDLQKERSNESAS